MHVQETCEHHEIVLHLTSSHRMNELKYAPNYKLNVDCDNSEFCIHLYVVVFHSNSRGLNYSQLSTEYEYWQYWAIADFPGCLGSCTARVLLVHRRVKPKALYLFS